jgi:hypothetical protein
MVIPVMMIVAMVPITDTLQVRWELMPGINFITRFLLDSFLSHKL